VNHSDIGYEQALGLALENVSPLGEEIIPIERAVGRIISRSVPALVDSPSVDASFKDGYAVVSRDLVHAGPENPVTLEIVGHAAAGEASAAVVRPGTTVRILSGAALPPGADAILAEEFVTVDGKYIHATADAEPGRNVLEKGCDVCCHDMLAAKGDRLTPQRIGLMVAGGISEVPVHQIPRIGLLATGSEILLPGRPIGPGKVYASNMALQQAWFLDRGIPSRVMASGDSIQSIADAIRQLHAESDVIITSGGAWKGDRDLVVSVLESLGWRQIFHRVRMGPGKAAGMGILDGKPVFCLPGGPASNESAFIMIALPAVMKMAGFRNFPYMCLEGRLEKTVFGQADWTQFLQCDIIARTPEILLRPGKLRSRLFAMARADAVLTIPEGVSRIPAGAVVPFICLNPDLFSTSLPEHDRPVIPRRP